MTFWEKVNAFFMSDTYLSICLFLLGVAALIWCIEMVCDTFVKRKPVADFITDCEHKLNALLDLHNVRYWRDVYESSRSSTRDVLDQINEKLDVLLSGPMDKETLEELKAEREGKFDNVDYSREAERRCFELGTRPTTFYELGQLLYANNKNKKNKKVSDSPVREIEKQYPDSKESEEPPGEV